MKPNNMQDAQMALLLELVLDLKKDLSVVKEISIKNTASLDEHMRRTVAAEERADIAEKRLELVEDDVSFVKNLGKLVGWTVGIIGGIAGIIYSIIQSLH